MMIADGTLKIYTLQNTAAAGAMPADQLVLKYPEDVYYSDRVIGFRRQYAAMGADQFISKLVRIWDMPVEVGEYIVIDGVQYRIDQVQLLKDEDGLKVRDLTLAKLEDRYDCTTGQASGS